MKNRYKSIKNELTYFYKVIKNMDIKDNIKQSKINEHETPLDEILCEQFFVDENMDKHLEEKNLLKDRIRTEYLNDIGFTVFRFYNSDILNNLESVLTFLYNELVESPSSELRSPSPIKGEGIKHQP